jgi:hypothetical protein
LNPDRVLEIYIIRLRSGKPGLFSPTDVLQSFEEQSGDRVRRSIAWLSKNRVGAVAWLGRVLDSAHDYYVRLEARLDPVERILKAMDSAKRYVIFHSTARESHVIEKEFVAKLSRQRRKHVIWFVVDLVLSAASLTIAWLPGPNLVGWYPFLRSLSHYGAFMGARAALRSGSMEFKALPELGALEENLHSRGFDRTRDHTAVKDLRISGLEQYLERMF